MALTLAQRTDFEPENALSPAKSFTHPAGDNDNDTSSSMIDAEALEAMLSTLPELPKGGPDEDTQKALDEIIFYLKKSGYRPRMMTNASPLDVGLEIHKTLSSVIPDTHAEQKKALTNYLMVRLIAYCYQTNSTGVSARFEWLAEPDADAPGVEGNDHYVEVLTETKDVSAGLKAFNEQFGQTRERHLNMGGSSSVQSKDMGAYHALGTTLHYLYALGTVESTDIIPVDARLDLQLMAGLGADLANAPAGLIEAVQAMMSTGEPIPEAIMAMIAAGNTPLSVESIQMIATTAQLHEALAADVPDAEMIAALTTQISELLTAQEGTDTIPQALIDAAMESLSDFAGNEAVAELLIEQGHEQIVTDYNAEHGIIVTSPAENLLNALQDIAQQLQDGAIDIESLPPEVQALIEKLGDLEAMQDELATAALADQIEAVLAGEMEEIPPELQALIDELGGIEALAALENREALIEKIDAMREEGALPPELAAYVDGLGQEAMVEKVQAVLDGHGDPALAADLQAITIMMNDPAVLEALPPEVLKSVETALAQNAESFETLTVQAVVADLQAQLAAAEPGSPEAAALETMIDQIQTDGMTAVDPVDLPISNPQLAELAQKVAEKEVAAEAPQISPAEMFQQLDAMLADEAYMPEEARQEIERLLAEGDINALTAAVEGNKQGFEEHRQLQQETAQFVTHTNSFISSISHSSPQVATALTAISAALSSPSMSSGKTASTVSSMPSSSGNNNVVIYPKTIEQMRQKVEKDPNLTPQQRKEAVKLLDKAETLIKKQDAPKPACHPVCGCQNDAAKGAVVTKDGTKYQATKDGGMVVTAKDGTQTIITAAELARQESQTQEILKKNPTIVTNLNDNQIAQMKRIDISPTGEPKINPIKAFEHACGANCNHDGAPGPRAQEPGGGVPDIGLKAEATDTKINFMVDPRAAIEQKLNLAQAGGTDAGADSIARSGADASVDTADLFKGVKSASGADMEDIKVKTTFESACETCPTGCTPSGPCGGGETKPKNERAVSGP